MSESAEQIIRAHSTRFTRQRQRVLEALMQEENDLTAQQLHDRLKRSHPSIGLATVYRSLKALAEAGVIDSLAHGDSTCFRYCAPGHHHHMTCRSCHRVLEIRDCELDAWAGRVGRKLGFREVEHTAELTGICGAC